MSMSFLFSVYLNSFLYTFSLFSVTGSEKRIFVSDELGQKLWMADITKMAFSEIPIPITNPLKATYDPVKGYAYVAQSNYLLSRIRLDGSYQQSINLTTGVGNRK